MKNPAQVFREALHTRLLTTGYRVFWYVPDETDGPYIVHGDVDAQPHGTKSQVGWDVSVMIHFWDARPGSHSPEYVNAMMNEAMEKLTCGHDPLGSQSFLSITGYNTVMQEATLARTESDRYAMPHAVLEMTLWITEA
jgi:hypothetical protein